ncbi:MAG: hypothetical protein HGB15_00335 [Chlorobaculum sp.]|nr:hypothetical protein [Chlorobaculum sp.]
MSIFREDELPHRCALRNNKMKYSKSDSLRAHSPTLYFARLPLIDLAESNGTALLADR